MPDLPSKNLTQLSLKDFATNPLDEFRKWYNKAEETGEPQVNAMSLATVSSAGIPSVRIVLLKDFSNGQFVFFTNYDSPKAQELNKNPHAALVFHWKHPHLQVRVSGLVTKTDMETSRTYFQSRPVGSQQSAWASNQSQAVESREELVRDRDQIIERYAGQDPLPLPPFWGGYQLEPDRFEFWSERADRLHDRICYKLEDGKWHKERLAP